MMLGGKTVFPITLGNGPPFEATCPDNGLKGWTEVARAGVKMLRTYPKWTAANTAAQIKEVGDLIGQAPRYGLHFWVGLYNVANDLSKQAVLQQIVDGLKDSPGLGAWKGALFGAFYKVTAPTIYAPWAAVGVLVVSAILAVVIPGRPSASQHFAELAPADQGPLKL